MTDLSTAPEGVDAADDPEANGAVETPESEDHDAAVSADGDDDNTDDGEQPEGDGDAEDEEIEFDFGGNKMSVPKGKIPPELATKVQEFAKSTWADYTRKSQEVGERAKALEAREGAVQRMMAMSDEVQTIYSRGLQIRQELEQLDKVDMERLWQSDPDRARRASDYRIAKQAELQGIANTLATKEAELTRAQEAEFSRRVEEGRATVTRTIKGFDEKALVSYAVSLGMPEAHARDWPTNPIMTQMAWKAMLYDRMQAAAGRKKPAAPKAPAASAQPVKPLPMKGQARPASDPDKLSTEEWMKRRLAGKI